jgi:DNA-binding transcriptional MerR regulator
MDTGDKGLTVQQVARISGCHSNTVRRFEARGFLRPWRDVNNFRRFTLEDAKRLKKILEIRRPAGG